VNREYKDIIKMLFMAFLFILSVFLLVIIINYISKPFWVSTGFCLDKEGLYNIHEYPLLTNFIKKTAYFNNTFINCSNKKNSLGIVNIAEGSAWNSGK